MVYGFLHDIKLIGSYLNKMLCYHVWRYDSKDLIGTKYTCTRCKRHKHEYIRQSWWQKQQEEKYNEFR